jgi:hypothetical protein
MLNGIAIRYYTLYTIHKPIAEIGSPLPRREQARAQERRRERDTNTKDQDRDTYFSLHYKKYERYGVFPTQPHKPEAKTGEQSRGQPQEEEKRDEGGRSMRGSKCKRPKDIRDHGNGEGEKTQTRERIRYHSLLRYAHARGGMPDHPGASQSIPGRHRG